MPQGASTHPTHAGKQRTYYLGEIIQRVPEGPQRALLLRCHIFYLDGVHSQS